MIYLCYVPGFEDWISCLVLSNNFHSDSCAFSFLTFVIICKEEGIQTDLGWKGILESKIESNVQLFHFFGWCFDNDEDVEGRIFSSWISVGLVLGWSLHLADGFGYVSREGLQNIFSTFCSNENVKESTYYIIWKEKGGSVKRLRH